MNTSVEPNLRELLRRPEWMLLLGFGAGLAPRAPGTWGTLVAIPGFYLVSWLTWPGRIALIVVLTGLGIWLCNRYQQVTGRHDDGCIVWDEIVGYLLATAFVPFGWWQVVSAFLLFRLFDIWKPGPIGWLDRRVPNGLGVMLDDIAAGLLTAALLGLFQWFKSGVWAA